MTKIESDNAVVQVNCQFGSKVKYSNIAYSSLIMKNNYLTVETYHSLFISVPQGWWLIELINLMFVCFLL